MNTTNLADPTAPKPGQHVYFTIDGKSAAWGTIAEVNDDGTLNINAHSKEGGIVGGYRNCKKADGMNHSVPETWWV